MTPGKRVFIGVPGQKYTPTSCWDHLGETFLDPDLWGKHQVTVRANPTSGHLDMARTMLIRQGITWRANYIAQKDSDVVIETPFLEVMSYLAQDFSHGAGIVFSPTTSIDWKAQFHPLPGHPQSDASNTAPFECDSGAGGFMVMTREVAERLTVLGTDRTYFGTADGLPEDIGLLCINRPSTDPDTPSVSEDVSLMRNVRDSTGLKVVCDPRILTGHLQPIYRPSMRPIAKLPPGSLERIIPPVLFKALVDSGVLRTA